MRNFYLFQPALRVASVKELEEGIKNLNDVLVNRDSKKDYFICNDNIWECDTTQGRIYEMFGGIVNEELQRLIPFVFSSFTSQEAVYANSQELDEDYPNDCNGFTGFDFANTAIEHERQVRNLTSYNSFVTRCRRYGFIVDVNEMHENLLALFPNFSFEARAIEETLNWKNTNMGLYDRLFELFNDIPLNPFQGGIGETEVLKGKDGMASKRINQAHRVTYRVIDGRYRIYACSGHYN